MKRLTNIELDLLFRIDFFALTNFGEEGYTDDTRFDIERKELKKTYGFSQYFQRENQGYEYVRLSDLEKERLPYIKYLRSLDEKEIFNCCQLEQAIGVYHGGDLKAFLSTDSGLCYNSPAHFDAVGEILKNGESDLDDINTFYGKVKGDSIEFHYSPRSNNIDINKTEDITSISMDRGEFEIEFKKLINRVNEFFKELRSILKTEMTGSEKADFIEEVFKEIKTKA